MAYKTKITVVTNGKTFEPGSILPKGISGIDMDFLKEKKFVELVEDSAASDAVNETMFDGEYMSTDDWKTADEIQRIRSKKDLIMYGNSIGCEFGDDADSKSLKELADLVINYSEEMQ